MTAIKGKTMWHQQHVDVASSYLDLRAAGRAFGRAFAREDPDLRDLQMDFGGWPPQPELRALRGRLRPGPDRLAAPVWKRLEWWAERTYTLALASLAHCVGARNANLVVGMECGTAGLTIMLRPTWAANVAARGVAVVEGCLTLSVRQYPHALPDGVRAYYATWAARERTGFVPVKGALYRASSHDEWQHAHAELGAMDHILDNPDPHITVPERPPRVRRLQKTILRVALTVDELALARRAARTAGLTLTEWATVAVLAASTPGEDGQRSALHTSFARSRVLRSDAVRYLESLRIHLRGQERWLARSVHRCPSCGQLRLDIAQANWLGVSELDCIQPGGNHNCRLCKMGKD